jgi:hypothetical protein
MDADLNRYDSFHTTCPHPRMDAAAWRRAYERAWAAFYSVENMPAILRRVQPRNYWSVFANFIWSKHSTTVEGGHPMLHGFIRMKGRRARRPGLPIESRRAYLRRRLADAARYARRWPALALEMEEVWLQTRPRSPLERAVVDELGRLPAGVRDWRRVRTAELQAAYARARQALRRASSSWGARAEVSVPARGWLWLRQHNPFAQSLTWSRRSLARFWRRCGHALRRGRLDRVDPLVVAFHLLQEAWLAASFSAVFWSGLLARLYGHAGRAGARSD